MKSCGIVAEYNPLHKGHAYQLQQAKQQAEADIIVAIMSGNFVQRGEVAILNKWLRAEEALRQGVDVVVELPSVFAIQSADYFGLGAMKIAKSLQIDAVSFGSETADVTLLKQAACTILQQPKDFQMRYQQQWENQVSILQTPNNQLGVSYLRGMRQLEWYPEIYPILRKHAKHTDQKLPECGEFSSGTALRQAIRHRQTISGFVSESIEQVINEKFALFDDNVPKFKLFPGDDQFWQLLQYEITMQSHDDLKHIYQMREGIEYTLKSAVKRAKSYDDFIKMVANKRISRASVQRLCCYIVLKMTDYWVKSQFDAPISMVRVLAANEKGIQFLKTRDQVDVVTQLKKRHIAYFKKQLQVDDIYTLMTNEKEQNFKRLIREPYENI